VINPVINCDNLALEVSMAGLEIVNDGDVLYVDSRLIAERLGVEHDNFLQTVQSYQTQIEQVFGILLFETGKIKGRGRPSRHALLTEDQATFVMTLSRNTPEVVQCKIDLVHSFSNAKKLLKQFNPVSDVDRVGMRLEVKDRARLELTDQVKVYLEEIRRYDDRNYRGMFFVRVHDAINLAVTNETAVQMKARLGAMLNKKVLESDLIRDYFPTHILQHYISLCRVAANLITTEQLDPLEAVKRATILALPGGYVPSPIDFVEHIKFVQGRLTEAQRGQLQLPDI
jgi:phage regulator Rha-like protein